MKPIGEKKWKRIFAGHAVTIPLPLDLPLPRYRGQTLIPGMGWVDRRNHDDVAVVRAFLCDCAQRRREFGSQCHYRIIDSETRAAIERFDSFSAPNQTTETPCPPPPLPVPATQPPPVSASEPRNYDLMPSPSAPASARSLRPTCGPSRAR